MSQPADETSAELKSSQFLRLKEGDTNFEIVDLDFHQYFIRAESAKKREIRLYDLSLISDARPNKLPTMSSQLIEQIKSHLGGVTNLEENVMCLVYRSELKWHYIVRPTMLYFFGAKPTINQWITVVNRECVFKDFIHLPLLTQLEKMHQQIKLSAPISPAKLPLDVLLKILNTDTKRKSRITEALAKFGLITSDRCVNTDKMSFSVFFKFYMTLTRDRCDILKSVLSPEKPSFEKKEFQNFINAVQRDPRLNSLNYPPLVIRKVAKLISEYDNKRESDSVSFEGVVRYLMSRDNLEVDTTQFDQTQDMDKPISSYYINSSHNTYLEGRQMMAQGSVEMYIQCMLLGCRCVELDCWDDINDEPVITHGGAFVNKLNFEEVIKVIADYAFVVTDYPLVLSFENRSKNSIVQDKMVQICKKHFGDMLLDLPLDSHPLEENVFLPSPNMLKRKILIKNKRLLPPERRKTQIDVSEIPDAPPQRKDRMATLARPDAKIPKEFADMQELDEETATFGSEPSTVDKLVNYVQASKFNTFEECFDKNIAYEMFSFSESKAYGFIMNQPKLFTMYNKFQISRIYPYWKRINSDNLMPQIFWNVGCQMVALNYQTPDLPIMLNHAKFEYNNRRGYISKPACLHLYRHEAFNAFAQVSIPYVVSASFQLRVLSAQFVRPDVNNKIFVNVEIYGLPADTLRNETSWNTNAVLNNFLVEFDSDLIFKAERILLPDIAMVKFNVFEEGNKLLAHRTLSFLGLQTGFRHVLLRDKNIHPVGISSLFVEIKIQDYVPPEAESIVQSLISPQTAAKVDKKEEDDEETAKLYRIKAMRSLMGTGEPEGLDIEIVEEGMKCAPKQINMDTFTALQTQRKLPPTLEEVMQRSHVIDPLGREHIGENKASKSLEAKLVKESLHLSRAQTLEREKYKKFLLKELSKFNKDSKKTSVKLSVSLTERGVSQEMEARLKVRENELDEQMKEKEGAFVRAEEALKISHDIKRTTLAISELQTIHKDQLNALMRKSKEEDMTMLGELSEEERALIRVGEVGLDKKGVARIRTEIKEMIILKKKKSLPQLNRLQKLELDKLVSSQREYIKQLEEKVISMKESIGQLIA